jgi:hypothetical protein
MSVTPSQQACSYCFRKEWKYKDKDLWIKVSDISQWKARKATWACPQIKDRSCNSHMFIYCLQHCSQSANTDAKNEHMNAVAIREVYDKLNVTFSQRQKHLESDLQCSC